MGCPADAGLNAVSAIFPMVGKQISLTGSKTVVLWALGGYGVSFTLLGLGSVLMATGAVTTAVGLGILIIARIVYGLTASAMVPACQVWALQRAGRRESHGRSGNHQLRPELRQAIRAAVRGGNVGHSPSGASVDADGSSGVGCGDVFPVARHTTTAHTGSARASA